MLVLILDFLPGFAIRAVENVESPFVTSYTCHDILWISFNIATAVQLIKNCDTLFAFQGK